MAMFDTPVPAANISFAGTLRAAAPVASLAGDPVFRYALERECRP